ncbi:MAG: DUF4340 domain-containing protein [Caldilineaceae bacterium]|nr:DUF4340 domain-containing protein [Caldilineaceae bacterium]
MSNSVQTNSTLSANPSRLSIFGSRWIPFLILLFVLQLAATAVAYWPSRGSTATDEPLLPNLALDQIQKVTITDRNDKQVDFVRKGSEWVLPDADDYPVKTEKVTSLLEKVAGLKRDRLVGTQSTTLTQLNVADAKFTRRIELTMADGSQTTLYVGDGPRFRTSHVRLGGENNAYLSLDFSTDAAATRLADWIDVSFFHIAEADVQKMTLHNSNGIFDFYRDDQNQWQMSNLEEGEEFNSNNLTSMLTTLSSLSMAEPLGKEEKPAYGLDKPEITVQLTYKDETGNNKDAELLVGALDSTQNYYTAFSSESPYYVYIPKYSMERFASRTREDFLQQPPTPTPAP